MGIVEKTLRKAKNIVTNPATYNKGNYAVDAWGCAVLPRAISAVKWCSVGAIDKFLQDYIIADHCKRYLRTAILKLIEPTYLPNIDSSVAPGHIIAHVNDTLPQHLPKVFDLAIKLAAKDNL
jgi:hypothetical protein